MDQDSTEVLVLWLLTGLAVVIMVLRVSLRWNIMAKLEAGDYITLLAIVAVLIRGSVVHVAMEWGTNQISAAERAKTVFTPVMIYRHEIGAKMTMVNRTFYTVYVWLQKCVVMCVVQQLLKGLEFTSTLRVYWATLAVTFIGSVISCFVECSPFQLYWQVVPDPGTCASGTVQLIVFSTLEILTDIMLMVLPLWQLMRIHRPWMARLRLILLFMVGTTIIAVTLARLLLNVLHLHRTGSSRIIANLEIFFAAFVANAPPLYGLINMKVKTSTQRSRSQGNTNNSLTPGRQLDTLTTKATGSKVQRSHLSDWPNGTGANSYGKIDSDEELFIGSTQAAISSTSSSHDARPPSARS